MSFVDPESVVAFEGQRRTYDQGTLEEHDASGDPFVQLRAWLDDAEAAGVTEPPQLALL